MGCGEVPLRVPDIVYGTRKERSRATRTVGAIEVQVNMSRLQIRLREVTGS
jgi:hypothetical protein